MRLVHLLKVSRLEGLTDGVFSIAMTILILDLRIPSFISQDLMKILEHDTFYRLLIYAESFIILGTLWVAMNFQLGLLQRINRPYLWTNISYLMIICIIPFSVNLVGSFPKSVTSISVYAVNLLFTSFSQILIFSCARYFKLNKDICTPAITHAVISRIAVGPFFYIASLILAHWNTHAAFILLIAPTIIYIFPGMIDRYESMNEDK